MKGSLLTVTNSLVDACGLLKFQSVASSTRMQVHCTCYAGLHIVLLMQTSIILCSASNAHCLASAVVHAVLLWHKPVASSTTVQVHCICHEGLRIELLMQTCVPLQI